MSRRMDENRIRELVRLGVRSTPVPERTEARILEEIRSRTQAQPRRSLFALIRYQPALTFAVLLVVVVPLLAVLGATLFTPGGGRASLTVASDKGGSLTGRTESLRFGEVINEKAVITTGPAEQTALESPGRIALQLFSNSEIQIAVFNPRNVTVALRRGSLYVNKMEKTEADKLVRLTVDLYMFTLKGTRVYASVDGDRRVTLICFEGVMEIASDKSGADSVLFTLTGGERAVIGADGTWNKDTGPLSDEEKALDETMQKGLPRTEFVPELTVLINMSAGSDSTAPGGALDVPEEEVPPYAVTAVGSIAARTGASGDTAFYATAAAGGRVFLVNKEAVFTLEKSGVKRRDNVIKDPSFRVRPVPAGKLVAFATPTALVLVDAAALTATSVLPLPAEGTIDHNFLPRFENNLLYVPVQNKGYYRVRTAGAPALDLFVAEPFPVTPVARGGRLFIGSYYNNYFGAVDASGKELFKTPLRGKAFTNMVSVGDAFYLFQEEGSRNALVRLDQTGRETGRIPLARSVTADFTVADKAICGIYNDGTLFVADTAAGRAVSLGKIFQRKLSTRQWRNASLAAAGKLVYAPTDSGKILVINPAAKAVVDEIVVPGREAFYTAPFFHENAVYAVANSGTVYRMVKNVK